MVQSITALPPPEIPLALLFFNIGVEIGQVLFVFAVLAMMLVIRYITRLERSSTVVLHAERAMVYVIGILASYWLIERTIAIFPAV